MTDQTPGIAQGTPAISDAWMTPWMEYMYMDQPLPHNATGVPVSIDAVDPNGNFVHIGNATSDITGIYSFTWTPPDIPGNYTIVATFSADNSYYGSSGETAAIVGSPSTTVCANTYSDICRRHVLCSSNRRPIRSNRHSSYRISSVDA